MVWCARGDRDELTVALRFEDRVSNSLGFVNCELKLRGGGRRRRGPLCDDRSSATPKGLTTCAACGILLSLGLEPKQLGALLCDEHDKQCMTAAEAAAAEINSGAESPDEICARIGLCPTHCALWTSPGWPPGNLPPAPKRDPANTRRLSDSRSTAPANGALRNAFQMAVPAASAGFFGLANVLSVLRARLVPHGVGKSLPAPCTHRNITCIIDHFTDLHLPLLDSDQDAFATTANRGLRGSHWRGADCNDHDASVYAGRRLPSAAGFADVDHDCNGISGGNASGTYEELLCSATARRGFIHIGDSATAHFHLPPAWLTRAGWTLDGVLADVLDELDWPACAWGSGYKDGPNVPQPRQLAHRTDPHGSASPIGCASATGATTATSRTLASTARAWAPHSP